MSDPSFVTSISAWLTECNYTQLKKTILDMKNATKVKEYAMDIITVICCYLKNESTQWSTELEECCEFALIMVSQIANPKEVLIALQEQLAEFGSSPKFKILLLPFQASLLQIPDKQSAMLNMVLETICKHLKCLPIPPEAEYFERSERLILDADSKVQCIYDTYEALAEFYSPFTNEVSLKKATPRADGFDVGERRRVLKEHLLRTLTKPIACLDLHVEEGKCSSLLRKSAEKLVCHLESLTGNFFSLLPEFEVNYDPEKKSSSLLGLGVLFYMIYGEQFHSTAVPQVYSVEFIVNKMLHLSCHLLSNPGQLVNYKGVLLLQGVLRRISDSSLFTDMFDQSLHLQVYRFLSMLSMTEKYSRELRTSAVLVWRLYLSKIDLKSRHRLLSNLMFGLKNVEVKGLIINSFKDELARCLDSGEPLLFPTSLDKLLQQIWTLPQAAESDLLEHADTIMCALNLARFLCLKDRRNSSGFAQTLPYLKERFLQPLSKAIGLSRSHYSLELRQFEDRSKRKLNTANLADITTVQELAFYHKALNYFDMLESVLARVNECLGTFERNQLC